jgi:pimeloyl-ACP methyl ester carboxylesterase
MTVGPKPQSEWRDLEHGARTEERGSYVHLGRGYTHYEESGPSDAKSVVLIHGFSVPCFIWDPTFEFLSAIGRHVVRYDLFGRGFSDRPAADYSMGLYLEQLEQLLDALGVEQTDLIGLSMGGPIAAAFCCAHPDRVGRLVLIGPSGTQPISRGWLYRLAVLPRLGEALFALAGNDHMLNSVARDFFDPAQIALFRERYRRQMEFRGFRRAILSSIRCGMLGSFTSLYARLGQQVRRILLVWGENDHAVPFDHNRRLRELLPQADFMPVRRCGHIPHFERPDLINPRLLRFLN